MLNAAQQLVERVVADVNAHSGHHTSDVDPADEHEICWAWVGHNASHQFYLGYDAEGRLYRYACGDEFDDAAWKADGEPELTIENEWNYIHPVASAPREIVDFATQGVGYIGHW